MDAVRRWAPRLAVLTCAAALLGALRWRNDHRIRAVDAKPALLADGNFQQVATLISAGAVLHTDEVTTNGVPSSAVTLRQLPGGVAVLFRPPVRAGSARLLLHARSRSVALPLSFTPAATDSFGDGTPDWMRLHTAEDRAAFRRWFIELAERMAAAAPAERPAEIVDCASLLRYSYREALRVHDDKWYKQFGPVGMPALSSVRQWSYPNTPLGLGLFRIAPGSYTASDAARGVFQSFADAHTLMARNTTLLGRELQLARPGDLIFYRVLEQQSQYHSMIVTGERGEWVVYHTGPIDGQRGEMRRVLLADLLQHPDPKWHPVPGNPNFLGVFRWNILREE